MQSSIALEPSDVPPVFRRAFPSYNGRKFTVKPCESVTVSGTYWSGGSRSRYALLDLGTGRASIAPPDHPYFDGRGVEGTTYAIPPGFAVVEHSIFCGKDLGLTFYARPENVRPLLPAPAEVDDRERSILAAIAGLKSGPYRREALGRLGFDDATRDRLKGLGLIKVNKAGAISITVAGRNARGDARVH